MGMDKIIKKKRWTLKKISAIALSVLFLFFVIYVFLLSDNSSRLNVEKERVTICEVTKDKFQEYIPVTGTAQPIQTFYLDVIDGGRVVEKYVEEGALLKVGDPIVRFENRNLKLQVMNNQSNFLQAESQLRTFQLQTEQNRINRQNELLRLRMELLKAQRNYNLSKRLKEKKLTSDYEFQTAKENYDYYKQSYQLTKIYAEKDSAASIQTLKQVEMSIERMQKQLSLVENQLNNLTVRAPIDGQLTALNAEIGQTISNGYRLGQIDNINSYKIAVSIDEFYISRVQVGQKGKFKFGGKTFYLKIKTVYVQVKEGKFLVDMQFIDKAPEDIRRGQTFHVELELGKLEDAVLVDAGAFYQSTGGQWIFVVDPSGNFATKRKITLGRQNPLKFEVIAGLKPGEKVITSSYENYKEIDKLILN